MTSQENDFSANRLFFPCLNPSQSSHESVDSGCCDAEGSLNTCSKVFNTFSLINTPSQQQQQAPFPSHSTPPKRPPLTKPRSSMKKDETTTPTAKAAETAQTGGGASYKYLTWREKDRRRRFREEWKHLWLVVPHGMYEVMCLVCHKIMTQRKLDTIKRHTIRRHAELLSMSETERQRLYHDLVTQYFRRGGDFCGESDPFCSTSVPRLRQTGTRGSRMEVAGVRRHSRLTDVPSPFRARMSAPRRSEIDTHPLASSPPSVQTVSQIKPAPAMPMNLKTIENILFNGPHSIFTKCLMGFNPVEFPLRGKFDSSVGSLWRRNPLPHTCGMSTPHAFQSFKKTPSLSSSTSPQRSVPDVYTDSISCRAPLDMSTSAVPSMQASPSDLSIRRCASTTTDAGTSLTERLMRLVNTWDTAAVCSKSMSLLPPPPPPPPLPPPLLPTQSDTAALLLNR
ncbi:hypothetical protein ECG_00451 [Echinococcus granulosus]|uniref:Asparagine rich protein n=1 Tax=Echinococcus granulosus TaxID=6210 RepID=A0A068X0V3_ECHGR|nr:hypothetical protein ECG_00451 [Echinococcus granulosus]CDS23554.1 asparagine rich protein [Echinococcus granulosus]